MSSRDGKRKHRRDEGIPKLPRNLDARAAHDQRVAAKDGVRPSLLRAAVLDQHGRLPVLHRGRNLRIRHEFDFDLLLCERRGADASRRENGRQKCSPHKSPAFLKLECRPGQPNENKISQGSGSRKWQPVSAP